MQRQLFSALENHDGNSDLRNIQFADDVTFIQVDRLDDGLRKSGGVGRKFQVCDRLVELP